MTDRDLEGTVAVLTGGTSGIGRAAARRLAERAATVAIVGRDPDRGARVADSLSTETPGTVAFHRADLATQSAVRDLAVEIRESYDRLDVLAHNAGLSSRTRTETAEGVELTLAVNHLAPYLLTHELVDRLRDSAPARVVVTASGIHRRASLDFDDLQFERDYDALEAYARSKLANVAFTIELAERLEDAGVDVTANCFHPGFVPSTNLFRNASPWTRAGVWLLSLIPGIGTSAETGARRLERLATAPAYGERAGCYLGSDGLERPAPEATDPETRERLWAVSGDLADVDPDWP